MNFTITGRTATSTGGCSCTKKTFPWSGPHVRTCRGELADNSRVTSEVNVRLAPPKILCAEPLPVMRQNACYAPFSP